MGESLAVAAWRPVCRSHSLRRIDSLQLRRLNGWLGRGPEDAKVVHEDAQFVARIPGWLRMGR